VASKRTRPDSSSEPIARSRANVPADARRPALLAVDRRAPLPRPRIAYWTGWLSPEMEGCSKEVFDLKDHFTRSHLFGLSRYYTVRWSPRERYAGMNIRFYPLLRLLAPLLERSVDLHHIYGSLSEWFFLRALQRRPIVLTVATEEPPFNREVYRHVRRFVVHAPATARSLIARGFDPDRIRLIYPGIDVARFRPRDRASAPPLWVSTDPKRFRVLFATTPNRREGLEARGINLLLRTAQRLPDVDFFLPWRPWAGARRLAAIVQQDAPANVHMSTALQPDMTRLFHATDATIAPFLQPKDMKICPTSLVESLASGRPLLVSTKVGLADLVRDEGGGQVFEPSSNGLCESVEALRSNYQQHAANARLIAERHFDARVCHQLYEQLYQEVLRSPC
jgi:glycosyltransferase involved in cell wall biosynthesis